MDPPARGDGGAGGVGVIILDGFDDAIIGVCWTDAGPAAVYSRQRMVQAMVAPDCSAENAEEYIDFNVVRALPHIRSGPAPILVEECAAAEAREAADRWGEGED